MSTRTDSASLINWSRSPLAWLGLINAYCWVLPWLHRHGPYGGRFGLGDLYVGVPAAMALLIGLGLRAAPPALRRPLGFRLGACLFACVVGVAAVDLVGTVWALRFGRIWYFAQHFSKRENVADPELVWKHKPGLSWRGRKTPSCDLVDFRTDERGFRNPPGVSTPDVVFIGDSVTEAGEVPEPDTFVARAGAETGLSVLNLGVSGYGPQQELAVLKRYGLPLKPKAAVWQFTEWNDVIDAQTYVMRDAPNVPTGLTPTTLYLGNSPLVNLVRAVLPPRMPNRVGFVETGGRTVEQSFWPYQHDHHLRLPQGFEQACRAISEAQALCKAQGVEFALLYVPSHVRVLWPSLRFKSDSQRDRFCKDGRVDREDDLFHAVANLCRKLDCPLIDLTADLRRRAEVDNRRVYVANDPHLGRDGHDTAAHALVDWLAARGIERPVRDDSRVARGKADPPEVR
ncbi:MAG: hypothetical protein U0835_06495 [Isosphaeraceae bacterium]